MSGAEAAEAGLLDQDRDGIGRSEVVRTFFDRRGDDTAAIADLDDGQRAATDRAVGIGSGVGDRPAACLASAV